VARFYDALAENDSAVEAMGKDELKVIAAELVTQVRKSVTIDWTVRESARAERRREAVAALPQQPVSLQTVSELSVIPDPEPDGTSG